MKAMTEEKTFMEKKIRKITENEPRDKVMYQKQTEFMQQIDKRYQEACQSTKTEVSVKVTQNKDDGLYVVNITNRPKPEHIEGQVFSLDHPDLVPAKLTEDQFRQLKEKVGIVHKAMRIERKGLNIKTKKTQIDDQMADKTISKLGRYLFIIQDRLSKKKKSSMSNS
jgi:hypothetical protein